MLKKIKETTEFIKKSIDFNAELAIILGTGLGGLVDEIEIVHKIDYKDIPNFPVSTVEGHKGILIFGKIQRRFCMSDSSPRNSKNVALPPGFAARLRKLREARNLSKTDLADKAGPTYRTVQNLETNRHKRAQEKTLMGLAEGTEV